MDKGKKNTVKLENAYAEAQALFEIFDKKKIENDIELTPNEKDIIISNSRREAVERYRDNIFVDQNKIEKEQALLIFEHWKDIVSFGSGHPRFDQVPVEFIRNPFNYAYRSFCDAIRQKLIIDHCNSELNPKKTTTKPQPTFPEYLLHPDRERIAEALKTTFRGKKGKAIRLMIEVLNNQPQPLITYGNRQGKSLFDAMKLYFDWYIGSKQSIFDYKRINDETDYKAIEVRVLHILKSIENNN